MTTTTTTKTIALATLVFLVAGPAFASSDDGRRGRGRDDSGHHERYHDRDGRRVVGIEAARLHGGSEHQNREQGEEQSSGRFHRIGQAGCLL